MEVVSLIFLHNACCITKTNVYTILMCILQFPQGTGKKPMEKQLEQLEIKYPDKARGVAKFNVPLAHMITAGADFMLVPSRFEPCGLIQLHAMRYGTVRCLPPTISSFQNIHLLAIILTHCCACACAGANCCLNWWVGRHC